VVFAPASETGIGAVRATPVHIEQGHTQDGHTVLAPWRLTYRRGGQSGPFRRESPVRHNIPRTGQASRRRRRCDLAYFPRQCSNLREQVRHNSTSTRERYCTDFAGAHDLLRNAT
jgi:hypothetical protein